MFSQIVEIRSTSRPGGCKQEGLVRRFPARRRRLLPVTVPPVMLRRTSAPAGYRGLVEIGLGLPAGAVYVSWQIVFNL